MIETLEHHDEREAVAQIGGLDKIPQMGDGGLVTSPQSVPPPLTGLSIRFTKNIWIRY